MATPQQWYYYKDKSGAQQKYFGEKSVADKWATNQGYSSIATTPGVNTSQIRPQTITPTTPGGMLSQKSYLEPTRNLQDYLQSSGKDYSPASLSSMYGTMGLENRLGKYARTGQQHTAMLNLLKAEQQVKGIQEQMPQLQQQVEQVAPKIPQPVYQETQGGISGNQEVNGTYKYTPMTGADYGKVMDTAMEQIGTTDLASLIGGYSSGKLTTPEMELTKEQKQAQLDKLKRTTATSLQNLQQNMAARGLSFSGIRNQAEADLAANTLAAEAGINREFAANIISAARSEQSRRENALKVAEQNYNKALENLGYQYNPITDTVEMTLSARKYEEEKATKAEQETYERGVKSYELMTKAEQEEYNREQDLIKNELAQKRYELSAYNATKPTATQEKADLKASEIGSIGDQLRASADKEGVISPTEYLRLRQNVNTMSTSEFDDRFSDMLSQEQRQNLGIEKKPTEGEPTKWELQSAVWQWLASEGIEDYSEEEKRQMIMEQGFNPEDFGIY